MVTAGAAGREGEAGDGGERKEQLRPVICFIYKAQELYGCHSVYVEPCSGEPKQWWTRWAIYPKVVCQFPQPFLVIQLQYFSPEHIPQTVGSKQVRGIGGAGDDGSSSAQHV